MDNIKTLLEELSVAETEDHKENLSTVYQLLAELQDVYEPAIFIVNVKIDERFHRTVFNSIIETTKNCNLFNHYSYLGDEFLDRVVTVLSIDNHSSKMIFNPKHLTHGRYNNDFFTVNIINHTTNSLAVHQAIMTTQFNFRSYAKTINDKMKFSYCVRRDDINNRRVAAAITTTCDEYITTESVRDRTYPWISTKKVKNFKIDIDGEKAITGGRPGIPGSVYLTLSDKTSIILFKTGTCLIVNSKQKTRKTLKEFIHDVNNNVLFIIKMFNNFETSEMHKKIITTPISPCKTHYAEEGLITCNDCINTNIARNELNKMKSLNVNLEYLKRYQKYYTTFKRDIEFINYVKMNISQSVNTTKSITDVMSSYITQASIPFMKSNTKNNVTNVSNNTITKINNTMTPIASLTETSSATPMASNVTSIASALYSATSDDFNSILCTTNVAVFGLKKKEKINSGVFIQMPFNHRQHVSLFNGNRITFRSLKRVNHAKALISLYDVIVKDISISRSNIGNVFHYSDEDIYDMLDNYTSLMYDL